MWKNHLFSSLYPQEKQWNYGCLSNSIMFWKKWEKEQPRFILIHLDSKKKIPVHEGGWGGNFHYYLIGSIKRKLLWEGTSIIMLSWGQLPTEKPCNFQLGGKNLEPPLNPFSSSLKEQAAADTPIECILEEGSILRSLENRVNSKNFCYPSSEMDGSSSRPGKKGKFLLTLNRAWSHLALLQNPHFKFSHNQTQKKGPLLKGSYQCVWGAGG